MSSDIEMALARAWIAAQDDLDDAKRMDSVRVAADRLQAHGHPLGELVTLGLTLLDCRDATARASVQAAYRELVAAMLPEALGPFASLVTHPQAFDMRWSLCYLDGARLPLHKAHMYAGLLGVRRLDPSAMLAMFLEQPGARCLRRLTLDLGTDSKSYPEVIECLARCEAPLETLVIWVGLPERPVPPLAIRPKPYLHTFMLSGELEPLPEGDPNVAWTGDASAIRALGRAATGGNMQAREQALARIHRMGRNSGRYLEAVRANEPDEERQVRIAGDELLAYAAEASSLERQREQLEADGVYPRWALWKRWRGLVPCGSWFGVSALENLLREHNKLHDSPGLEPLSPDAMLEDSSWVEFRRQAAELMRLVQGQGSSPQKSPSS